MKEKWYKSGGFWLVAIQLAWFVVLAVAHYYS